MKRDLALERRALAVLESLLATPAAFQHARLDELCQGDRQLRSRVDTLFSQDARELELRCSFPWLQNQIDEVLLPRTKTIANFELVRPIGRGGMGEVFEAKQLDPPRTVALKLMRPGTIGAEARRRFADEARLLAHLRHAAIAQVIEAGLHIEELPTGDYEWPYIVLEYIENARSIVDYCNAANLNTRQRIQLLAIVVGAVHHGHQKGVIHRDLKPANILIGRDGAPKVIDFGVARVIGGDLARTTAMTLAGQIVGTIGYISPEVLAGETEFADVRSDVYSLGVVAYQLIVGDVPFALEGVALGEAARRVTAAAPLRPRARSRDIDVDLEAVLLQAIARDPGDRYPSAQALADDLERWLLHEPVVARRPSVRRRLALFWRRNPPLAASLLAIGALVVGGALVFGVHEANARATSERLVEIAERNAYHASIVAANAMIATGEIAQAKKTLTYAPQARRGWEWRWLAKVLDSSDRIARPFPDIDPAAWNLRGLDIDQARGRIAVGSSTGIVQVLDLDDASIVQSWSLTGDTTRVHFVGATELLLIGGSRGGEVKLLDSSSSSVEVLLQLDPGGMLQDLAVSSDGLRGACATSATDIAGGEVIVFDLVERQIEQRFATGAEVPMALTFARGARHLFVGTFGGALDRYDLDASGGPLKVRATDQRFAKHDSMVASLALSPDESRLAVAGGRQVAIWSVDRLELECLMAVMVDQLAFHGDPTRLVVAERATPAIGTVSIVEGNSVIDERSFGHDSRITGLALEQRSARIVSTSEDGTLRFWRADRLSSRRVLTGHKRAIRAVAATPDGARLVSVAYGGTLIVWDRERGVQLSTSEVGACEVVLAHPSLDLFLLAGQGLHLFCSASGELRRLDDAASPPIVSGAWHPSGETFATYDRDGALSSWSRSGERLTTQQGHALAFSETAREMLVIAFDSSGERLVACSARGFQEWAAGDLAPLGSWPGTDSDTFAAAYVPGAAGDLVSSTNRAELVLWRRQPDGTFHAVVLDRGPLVHGILFHPSEPRMFVSNSKGSVTVWDTAHWRHLLAVQAHGTPVFAMTFSGALDTLVTGAMDRSLRIWHAETGGPPGGR